MKQVTTKPKAIFFDAAGTLIHLPRSVGAHYREMALRFGIDPDAAALDRAFRGAWKSAPERTASDGPRPDDDKGWWKNLVERVFEEVLTPSQFRQFDLGAYFEAVYRHFAKSGVWRAFPEVVDVLATLQREGYRIGIISNFDRRLRKVLADMALAPYFEHIVLSSEVGVDKPDPRIFRQALSLFGVAAEEAWHVGDDPRNDWGAEAVGLKVFRLERPGHTLHDLLPLVRETAGT